MKKLMFAAATAAMVGGVFANTCITTKDECDECGEATTVGATAHKVTISLKAPIAKSTTKKASECEDGDCTLWYQQGSLKIEGLIWGELDDCNVCTADFDGQQSAFWTKEGPYDAEFAIGVGRIGKDKNSKKVQAYGTFGDLAWAGFGTLTGKDGRASVCEDDGECSEWVKSISGGIAGQIALPEAPAGKCEEACDELIEYTGCCDLELANGAAYGTIKIAYDKKAAKKLAELLADEAEYDLSDIVKLPKGVTASDMEDVVYDVTIEE